MFFPPWQSPGRSGDNHAVWKSAKPLVMTGIIKQNATFAATLTILESPGGFPGMAVAGSRCGGHYLAPGFLGNNIGVLDLYSR